VISVHKCNSESYPIYFVNSITPEFHGIPIYACYMKTNTKPNVTKMFEWILKDLKKDGLEKIIIDAIIMMIDKEDSSIGAFKDLSIQYILCIFHMYKTLSLEINKKIKDKAIYSKVLELLINMKNAFDEENFRLNLQKFQSYCDDKEIYEFKSYFEVNWLGCYLNWVNFSRKIAISIFNTNNFSEQIIKSFETFLTNKKHHPMHILMLIVQFFKLNNPFAPKRMTKSIIQYLNPMKEAFQIPINKLELFVKPLFDVTSSIDKEWSYHNYQITSFTNPKTTYHTNLFSCMCPYFLVESKQCKHSFLILKFRTYILNHQITFNTNPVFYLLNVIKYDSLIQVNSNLKKTLKSKLTSKGSVARKFQMFNKMKLLKTDENTYFEYDSIKGCMILESNILVLVHWEYYPPSWELFNTSYMNGLKEFLITGIEKANKLQSTSKEVKTSSKLFGFKVDETIEVIKCGNSDYQKLTLDKYLDLTEKKEKLYQTLKLKETNKTSYKTHILNLINSIDQIVNELLQKETEDLITTDE
jgi:hypothetical protein